MDNNLIFPQAHTVLEEAIIRHANVWPFALEAIDMAHIAFERHRDSTAEFVPGVPGLRRARNEINDDSWRYLHSIAEPLIDQGYIREFGDRDGGTVIVLPDNLHVRMKKGNESGETSNYPTRKISKMSQGADRYTLFPDATELDMFINDGLWLDIVYIAGESMSEYSQVGLRFATKGASPFEVLDPANQAQLFSISPAAFELVEYARNRLTG